MTERAKQIKNWYDKGLWTKDMVRNAFDKSLVKGLVKADEMTAILGGDSKEWQS